MRRPIFRVVFCFALAGLGLAIAWMGLSPAQHTTAGSLIGVAGIFLAFSALMPGLVALSGIRDYNRLRAGKGVVARWTVPADEWQRFRAIDKARSAQSRNLWNDFASRSAKPPDGVDVIIGPHHVMVDGSLHVLHRSVADGRTVNWLAGDPDCLEFPLTGLPGRTASIPNYTLRIPVPASARADGLRAFEHFKRAGPQPSATIP